MKKVALLGATGSIGENTLKVLRENTGRMELVAVAAGNRWQELAEIAREFGAGHVGIGGEAACSQAQAAGCFSPEARLYAGEDGLEDWAHSCGADVLVSAAAGTAGLKTTLAAIDAGMDIALASKEILVVAGRFVTAAARAKGVRLLPVDSEHSAIFQCLNGTHNADIGRLILTASGGAFRDFTDEQMRGVTPEQALAHPNWDMGPKITVDSATMANKGLELIEATWLFGVEPERLEVVIHRQSIVHSMVEFVDGSVLAQLSPPSMTFAIHYALNFPERVFRRNEEQAMDWAHAFSLDFQPPDEERFPCLRLSREALRAGGTAPAVFNAANEAAVHAFLQGELPFSRIPAIISETLEKTGNREPQSLADALAAEREALSAAQELIRSHPKQSPD